MSTPPVLYVLNRYPVLSQTFVSREISALDAAGQPIAVHALHPRPRPTATVAAHLFVLRRRPFGWFRALGRAARTGCWRAFVAAGPVARHATDAAAGHIHAHFAGPAAQAAGSAATMCSLRFTFTGHGVDIFRDTNERALRSSLVGVDTVVCVSEFAARDLERRFPDVRTVLIRNGVRVAPRGGGPSRGGPIVVAARLVPKKGIDTLVRAVAALDDVPDLSVEIIGDGRRSAVLRALASELGVAARVHFRGALPYEVVEEAFGRASMLVLPCRVQADGDRDNLPTAIVEALAHAVPVISTPVAGISEVVVPGRTGLLVAADDVNELAAAIRRLWTDHDFAVALGDRGRALVAERFDPDRSTAQLRRVFAGG